MKDKNTFLIIKFYNKQYKIYKDKVIKVEKIFLNIGKKIILNNILLLYKNNNIIIGYPYIKNIKVLCKIIKHGLLKKKKIFKMKRRKHHIKNMGHRQNYTKIKILKIKYGT